MTNTRYSTHPDLSRNLTNGVIHSFASRGIIRARSFVLPSLFLRVVHTLFLLFSLHRSLPMVQHYASGQAICRCLICGPFQYVQFFYAWIRHRIYFKAELSPSKKQRERETMTVVASKRGRPRVFLWCRWLLCRLCYNLLSLGECVIRLFHFFFYAALLVPAYRGFHDQNIFKGYAFDVEIIVEKKKLISVFSGVILFYLNELNFSCLTMFLKCNKSNRTFRL